MAYLRRTGEGYQLEFDYERPIRKKIPIYEWYPVASRTGWLGIASTYLLLACSIAIWLCSRSQLPSLESLALVAASLTAAGTALVLGIQAWGYFSLRYRLGPRELVIQWLWTREIVPLAAVQSVRRGYHLGAQVVLGGSGLPGHCVRALYSDTLGRVKFYGTATDPSQILLLTTDQRSYALTPADLEGFRTRLIERLEAVPEQEVELAPEPRTAGLPLLRSLLPGLVVLGSWFALASAGLLAAWVLLHLPTEVPDTSSPPSSTATGEVNDWTSVGQEFVARWDNLDRISVILATDKRTDQAEITFRVKTAQKGEVLRELRRTISLLPEGDPMRLRPGSLEELWTTFDFEPIPDSAGRQLYFTIEGKGVPKANSVRLLTNSHSGYPLGKGYLGGQPAEIHTLFRAQSRGHVADLLTVLGENLTRKRPGPLSIPALYLGLGLLYIVLVGALLGAARRVFTSRA